MAFDRYVVSMLHGCGPGFGLGSSSVAFRRWGVVENIYINEVSANGNFMSQMWDTHSGKTPAQRFLPSLLWPVPQSGLSSD